MNGISVAVVIFPGHALLLIPHRDDCFVKHCRRDIAYFGIVQSSSCIIGINLKSAFRYAEKRKNVIRGGNLTQDYVEVVDKIGRAHV